MKRFFSFILALFMLAAFTACGSSQGASASTAPVAYSEINSAESSVPEAPASEAEDSTILSGGETTVGMIYFLDLQDGSMMAACYDDAGTKVLGGDYLKVYMDNAEITDIDHKHGRLDNVLSLAASRLEHREQILDALLRLLGRAAGNKCASRRVQRKLAGDKYKTVCFDRLGVGADGAGGSGSRNHMLHGKILLYQCIFIITSCAICVKYSYSWKNGRN